MGAFLASRGAMHMRYKTARALILVLAGAIKELLPGRFMARRALLRACNTGPARKLNSLCMKSPLYFNYFISLSLGLPRVQIDLRIALFRRFSMHLVCLPLSIYSTKTSLSFRF